MKAASLFLSLMIILNTFSLSQDQTTEKYSQVRISIKDASDIARIESSGLYFDHGINKKGEYFETWLSESEIKMLDLSGVPYKISVEDWDAYYQERQRRNEISPDIVPVEGYDINHNIFGTMGGHLKWTEAINKLDSMRLEYPNLVSEKFSIGNSYENRPIWTVRITKNPDAPTGRPEVWYNGITHAREPMGMMNLYYYVYWLLENYNIDPVATYILNNREIYFTPFINPDGYIYNQTTNPNGGGMWRKNRRGPGTDLNRNFGTYNFWNSPNGGSSTSTSSDTYRGPYPFSEPETQAFRNFVNSRNFKVSLDYHTYGNLLIKPYAWCDPVPTPDDAVFNEFGADMTSVNNYFFGTPYQTVGYKVRGGDIDWLYSNDTTGHSSHVFGLTPEVGTSGFYATKAEIIPFSKMCLLMNRYAALVSGAYVAAHTTQLNKQIYTAGETGTFKVVYRNKGLDAASNIRIEWNSLNGGLTIPVQMVTKPSMTSRTSDSVTFSFTIPADAPNNTAIMTNLTIRMDDSVIIYTKLQNILVGNGFTIVADDAENGISNWTTSSWGVVTSQSHTPTHSFTDSPSGNYPANANSSLTLTIPINASATPALYLSFWERYTTEEDYDYCHVEVSNNNGVSWHELASYDGFNSVWTQKTFDLTEYVQGSQQVKVRFRLTADGYLQYDGWYIDDITIIGYDNVIPVELSNFTAAANGSSVVINWTTLTETNNNGFEVQRGVNINGSIVYSPIAFIKGSGTSSEAVNYSFVDNTPVMGESHYRLKQMDFDGTFKIYPAVEVDFNGSFDFELSQNYPNPFNPATKIKYTISETSLVVIKVYDMTGQEIYTLINEVKQPGRYEVNFDATAVSSGIYFYKITAGKYSSVRKMMVLK